MKFLTIFFALACILAVFAAGVSADPEPKKSKKSSSSISKNKNKSTSSKIGKVLKDGTNDVRRELGSAAVDAIKEATTQTLTEKFMKWFG